MLITYDFICGDMVGQVQARSRQHAMRILRGEYGAATITLAIAV